MTNQTHSSPQGVLQALLPKSISFVVAKDSDWLSDPMTEERQWISHSPERRLREFATGRSCLRQALKRFGQPPAPIGVGKIREPLLPNGFVGSISHAHQSLMTPKQEKKICVATAGYGADWRGLGVDIEIIKPLDKAIQKQVLSHEELDLAKKMNELFPAQKAIWEMVMFSAKESFYKAASPMCGHYFDFLEAKIDLDPEQGSFTATLMVGLDHPDLQKGSEFHGKIGLDLDWIYTFLPIAQMH